jgi:hypothetical protein
MQQPLKIGGRSDLDRRLFAAAGHAFVPTSAAPIVGAGRRILYGAAIDCRA